MSRKESRRFYVSVEGQCEELYFKHIEKLINNYGKNKYQAVIVTKQLQPVQFCKRFAGNADKRDLFLHIQDIEDYYDKSFLNSFYALISSLSEAKKVFGVSYELGYSNYSFELWLLLHVSFMSQTLSGRKDYLKYINKCFKKKYKRLDEFKNEKEFSLILENYVTLETVKKAIANAKRIVANNAEFQNAITFKRFKFYPMNPDLTVHMVIDKIFQVCGVK